MATKTVPLVRKYPDDLKSYFVANIVVQNQPEHFTLDFFEVWQPPIIGSEAEQEKLINQLTSIEAKCVVRVILTPQRMRDMVRLMTDNLSKFEARMDERKRGE